MRPLRQQWREEGPGTRLLEVRMANSRLPSYIEVNYLLVMVLAISTVPFPYMVESLKRVVAL